MANSTVLCKECGTIVSGGNENCPQCGAELLSSNSETGQKSTGGGLKKGCLIIFGVFFLLILVGTIFGEPAEEKDDSNEESGVEVEETSEPQPASEEINDPGISKAEFAQLNTGMSYKEAAEIVGSAGEIMSESEIGGIRTVMYSWDGESGFGANANAMFQNGKLVQKAQFGLE